MHDIKHEHVTHIALVLDRPAPVVVVDGVGNVVGDLGDALQPLDALFGVETPPIVGWMEKKETVSLRFVQSHSRRARLS